MVISAALPLILAASVASGSPANPASPPKCPPLTVTLDGKSVDMPHGLGMSVPETRGGGFIVSRFNHSSTECSKYVQLTQEIVAGELEVAAYVGPVVTNVRANMSSALGVKAYVVDTPKKVGELVSICVQQPVQHDVELNGHTVSGKIQGLISGTFCGSQAQE